MKTLIVGGNGRESALAWRMGESSNVYAFMGHENPSLIRTAERTGGDWTLGQPTNANAVADYAVQNNIDLAMVSSDDPLAAGVIDALQAKGIRAVGPTRAGAEIEWNKTYSRGVIEAVAPEANPFYRIAQTEDELATIFKDIGNDPVAVKPVGLTGGKGVKVVGPHLKDNAEAQTYARELMAAARDKGQSTDVIIEEKIIGAEFTLQILTDGTTCILPPTTFDYPYRFDGDTGPGTGGMGSYSDTCKNLAFMTMDHYNQACEISQKVLNKITAEGRHFNGLLYAGFFLTNKGDLKVIEFNARFGDPECMNIMMLLDSDWCAAMGAIATGTLKPDHVKFSNKASQVVYLVSPDYALGRPPQSYTFDMDVEAIENDGCQVFFSAAKHKEGNTYETVGTSRCVAVGCLGDSLDDTRQKIESAISNHVKGPLEWRRDMASDDNIQRMRQLVGWDSAQWRGAQATG